MNDQIARPKLAAPARQPFLGLTGIAIVGVVVADFWPLSPHLWLTVAGVLVLAALATFAWPRGLIAYGLVLGAFFLIHSSQIQDTPGLRLAAQLGDRPRAVKITGQVSDEPKIAPNGSASFVFKLNSIELEGQTLATSAAFVVRWRAQPQMGDELQLFGVASTIDPPRNPGEFDMRSYLARRDVYRSFFVRYPEDGVFLRRARGNLVLRLAAKSRQWMQNVLCRSLDDSPEVQNFISGIALGLRHQTPEDIEEPFQQTGTLHLFAVAGLHVGIVAQLLWILAIIARLSQKWAAAIIIPLLLFYAAITGLHISSVRAAVMSSIGLGAFFFERKPLQLNSVAAAAFCLLAWNTNELFATGFQLSFAVVTAIVLFAEPLFKLLKRLSAPDPLLPANLLGRSRRIAAATLDWLYRGFSVSLAAWVGSLPLMLWYFYLITPISLIANLVVVPIAFFVLAIALLSILTAPLFVWLSVIFNNANWCLARLVLVIVHWFALIPGGHYYVARPQWSERANTKITVLDVGAGGAVHLNASGHHWLFDCGSERDYNRTIRGYSHYAGINRVAGVLLSHGDSSHIGGAGPLLDNCRPDILIDNATPDRSASHRRLHGMFAARHLQPVSLAAGDPFEVSRQVTGNVLFPRRGFAAANADDQTFVLQLTIAPGTKVLFMFDSGYATENALLTSGVDLRSDIIVKGQHHSGQSGAERFLNAVSPKLIVATSRDFPATERITDEWAEMVRRHGIKLFRQDESGAVELYFREREWLARAYATGETFRSNNR